METILFTQEPVAALRPAVDVPMPAEQQGRAKPHILRASHVPTWEATWQCVFFGDPVHRHWTRRRRGGHELPGSSKAH